MPEAFQFHRPLRLTAEYVLLFATFFPVIGLFALSDANALDF